MTLIAGMRFSMPQPCGPIHRRRTRPRVQVAKAAIAGQHIWNALFNRVVFAVPMHVAIAAFCYRAPWSVPKSLTGWNVETRRRETLMAAARQNRYGHRDATMILIAFRHGLRASEVADLRWDQVDFNSAVLHIRRVKRGTPSVHPVSGLEMRALRRLQRESQAGPFIFVSERGAPFTTAGFARMMQRAAMTAGLAIKVHPHMLRHACGFALANAGHDTRAVQAYLGHANIAHTVRYTELAPHRFKHFWSN
jgi:site-specific recombinase XerD